MIELFIPASATKSLNRANVKRGSGSWPKNCFSKTAAELGSLQTLATSTFSSI
jgi:hypothetical protein